MAAKEPISKFVVSCIIYLPAGYGYFPQVDHLPFRGQSILMNVVTKLNALNILAFFFNFIVKYFIVFGIIYWTVDQMNPRCS